MDVSSDVKKIEAVIAPRLSKFVSECRLQAIPAEVRERAKLLMLDAIGVAFASSTYEFAGKTFEALNTFGAGNSAVIGFSRRLGGRDAILMNGVMIHGLDFDDTYLPGLLHATSGVFPCAFEATTALRKSGGDLLAAYILGMECSARIAAVAKGQLTQIGFHPSGVVNAFAAALAVGRLHGLTSAQLTMAQGIVLSMAAGSREYSAEGTWTKRLNPGWAGVCGTTAAVLAKGGFTGPSAVYEGRFGFYPAHLHGYDYDLSLATRGLDEKWELLDIAVKPFPACQMNIAPLDAAIAIATQNPFTPGDIDNVNVLVPEQDVNIVCEPIAGKRRPVNSYAAQFSIPFVVACALIHRRFGLAELNRYQDPDILALADRVGYSIDPNSAYPNQSGEVIVTLKDGRTFSQREQIPRGASERPLRAEEIVAKFMQNAELAISRDKAEQVRAAVLDMERDADGQRLATVLSTGRP